MKAIGLDIGTTTLSAIILDGETGGVIETMNIANGADMPQDVPGGRLQDANVIAEKAVGMVRTLIEKHGPVEVVGIDGQMHGMLYVDENGDAVSPLYTWQDGRGSLPCEGGTYASVLTELAGYPMASGFGLTTHYWFVKNGCVPEKAVKLCTIYDYAGMKLTGGKAPLMHSSSAASLGLYDSKNACWDMEAIRKAGMDPAMLPDVTDGYAIQGCMPEGAQVSCGIGDNQASFIGAVRDMDSAILVNIGTGGQVSMMSDTPGSAENIERRPLGEGASILVGSSLCGGRAYALLENFVRSCAAAGGYAGDKLYAPMNEAGLRALEFADPWKVDTRFNGTRKEPGIRGCFSGVSVDNFDFDHLVGGVLMGMAAELHGLYGEMRTIDSRKLTVLVGSGNGIRRNPALKKAFEMAFGLDMVIPAHLEEAAYGAALFGLAAAGKVGSLSEAQKLINYTEA